MRPILDGLMLAALGAGAGLLLAQGRARRPVAAEFWLTSG
jgi:hypothetical protein